MPRIAVIIGSTRPGRNGEAVAHWIHDIAAKRADAEVELVDLLDYQLPHLDEAMPPVMGQYAHAHTRAWSEKIAQFDAYVFVTPEYNHSPSAALKNSIDFLHHEWADKAAGFVGYGSVGGTRAVEQLRLVMGGLQVADVTAQVSLSLFHDFENFTSFKPGPHHEQAANTMLDQLVRWGDALRAVRVRPVDEASPPPAPAVMR